MRSKTTTATPPTLAELDEQERRLIQEADNLAAQRAAIREQEDLELTTREANLEQRREALRVARMSAEQREATQREDERRERVKAAAATAKKSALKLAAELEAAVQLEADALRTLERANAAKEQIFARQNQQLAEAARTLSQAGATQEETSEALGRPPDVCGIRIVAGRAEYGFYRQALQQTLGQSPIDDRDRPRSHVVIVLEGFTR